MKTHNKTPEISQMMTFLKNNKKIMIYNSKIKLLINKIKKQPKITKYFRLK